MFSRSRSWLGNYGCLAAAALSSETKSLSRELAEQGTLASLLPLLKAKEIEELLHQDPDLNAAHKSGLGATAEQVFDIQYARLMEATASAYADPLSVFEFRALPAFFRSPAAVKYRAATPAVIAATMKSVGQLDFKGDVRAAFCLKVNRSCAKK